MTPLQRDLLAWYARARRDLPWRATRDPYAIWISEAMLQQTRVEAVEPYWRRFLARFPTVEALAAADEEAVLAAWSGLGYYRRARALRAAARALVERHGGRFPRSAEELRALPGVGPYTAGAVLSIAFDLPEALVDGNVARVLCRLLALDAPAESVALRARLWSAARELVPRRDEGLGGPGAWNQALMELGATVCLPRAPRCLACPAAAHCQARARGRQDELPRPRRRPQTIDVELELYVVEQGPRLLLEQRCAGGRMSGLWELPARELAAPGAPARLHAPDPPADLEPGEPLGALRHGITRHRVRARLRAARLRPGAPVGPPRAWVQRDQAAELALTGLARKALRALSSRAAARADPRL